MQSRQMCKLLCFVVITILIQNTWAQECVNYVTVNGRQLEGKPACYFASYGDDRTPHMEVEVLAQALGANLVFDDRDERYIFARANELVEISASRDILQALVRRDGVLYANGDNLRSTMAIQVDTLGYAPITAIVDAFNGATSWDAGRRSVHIITSNNAYNSEIIAETFTQSATLASGNVEATRHLTPITDAAFVINSDNRETNNNSSRENSTSISQTSDVEEVLENVTPAPKENPEENQADNDTISSASNETEAVTSEQEVNIRPQSVVPIPLDVAGNPLPYTPRGPDGNGRPFVPPVTAPPAMPPVATTPVSHTPVTPPPVSSTPVTAPPVVLPPQTSTNPETQPAVSQPTARVPAPVPVRGIYRLTPPRVGLHNDRTRVALDIPAHIPYHIAINGNIMVVSLPYTEAFSYDYASVSDYVNSVNYKLLDNTLSLVVTTTYGMTSDGFGYKANFINDTDNDGLGVLYVDFSPYLRGDGSDILQNYSLESNTSSEGNPSLESNITPPVTVPIPEPTQPQPIIEQVASVTPQPTQAVEALPIPTLSSGNVTISTTPPISHDAETSPPAPTVVNISQQNVNQQPEAISQQVSIAPANQPHRVVVIDPGHGGWDPGAQGYASEAEVVLGISLHLKHLLEQQGIDVVLTRENDVSLTEEKRSDLAARAELAGGAENNLFISIHANAAQSPQAQGIETWVFGQPLNPSLLELAISENGGGDIGRSLTAEAQHVAENALTGWLEEEQLRLSQSLASSVQDNMIDMTGARDRGVRKNAWYVIRNAQVPAILVEVGFVSNPDEGRNLASDRYQLRVAQGIANGINDFFGEPLAIAGN